MESPISSRRCGKRWRRRRNSSQWTGVSQWLAPSDPERAKRLPAILVGGSRGGVGGVEAILPASGLSCRLLRLPVWKTPLGWRLRNDMPSFFIPTSPHSHIHTFPHSHIPTSPPSHSLSITSTSPSSLMISTGHRGSESRNSLPYGLRTMRESRIVTIPWSSLRRISLPTP